MNWIRLDRNDLEIFLNKRQLDILIVDGLKTPGHDIVCDILSTVVAKIRNDIASSGLNMLDMDHARIPYELKDCAIHLALECLQNRFPTLEISQSQLKQADIARETLNKIVEGKLTVTVPLIKIRTRRVRKGVNVCKFRREKIRGEILI